MGFRSWTRAEGMNHMQDLDIASSRNGSMWIPKNLTTYLKFNHNFNDRFSFSAQTSIKQHHLDNAHLQIKKEAYLLAINEGAAVLKAHIFHSRK